MNIEELQLITRSETASHILKFFTTVKKPNSETNLEAFWFYLLANKGGYRLLKDEFYKFFTELEASKVGAVEFTGNTPVAFRWHFPANNICEQILSPNKMIDIEGDTMKEETVKRKRGRPRGTGKTQGKSWADVNPNSTDYCLGDEIPMKRTYNKSKKDIIVMFETSRGELFPFNMSDAARFISYIKKVQEQVNV